MVRWDFHGYLDDLIGDLQMAPNPIEIKLFSPDMTWLQNVAPRVEEQIKKIPGVVDTFDGLTETGPSINLRVRPADAERFGLTAQDIADAVNTALLGQVSSYMLQGDRIVNIRVMAEPNSVDTIAKLRNLPIRTADGAVVRLEQVADVSVAPSEVELNRDDLRQNDMVVARLEGVDLGTRHAGDPGQIEPGQMAAARHGRIRRLVSAAAGILPQSAGGAARRHPAGVHRAAD